MSSQNSSIGSCPSHWYVVKFSSIAELKHGYQFRTTDFTEHGVKILKITQIKENGSVDISSCSYIDSKRLKSFENNIVKKGDILMALSGATIGKIGRYKSDEIVLQNYRVGNFLPLDEKVLNKDYFYHFLTTENTYYQILANQNQSAQENIGKEDIHNMLVFLPPYPEQASIASVLSSLDDKIDLLHRQNTTLEKMAETLFRQWFVEEAKEEWEEGKLSDLVIVKYGKDHKMLLDGNIPVYGSGGLMRYAEKSLYDKESVLIPRKGTLNNVMYQDEPFWTVDTMFYTEMKFSNIAKFVYHFVKEQDLASMNVGSAVPSMTTEIINNMPIDLPPAELFEKFERAVAPLYKKMKSNQIQIQTLTAMRDNLLPKLMSGEVRVEN